MQVHFEIEDRIFYGRNNVRVGCQMENIVIAVYVQPVPTQKITEITDH